MRTLDINLKRHTVSDITTATVLHAAWALTTAAYANTNEAVFGLTLSGRDTSMAGIDKVMGITIATVPIKVVIDQTSTISEYLTEVQDYISEVKVHQHLGLQRIARLSSEAQAAAAFQNLFVVQSADEVEDHRGLADMGLRLSRRVERDTSDFVLTVQAINAKDGSVVVKAHHDENVISSQQTECVLRLFEHLYTQLASEAENITLHDIDMISPHDQGLLGTWNDKMPAAVQKTLHGLFEERARETPDAIALDGFDGRVTYAELDFLSGQLAGHLQRHADVRLESRVMLSFAKSKLPIFAMLAVLKCGAVCVSTNPEHPVARLLELTSDAESNVMLCNDDSVDRFRGEIRHVVAITGMLLEELRSSPVPRSLPRVLPSNASFIVYTSGSTGKPKGSVLEHHSLASDFCTLGKRIGLDAHMRTLQFSAYTFDAHILEIITTLIHGGCLCVISDHERMSRLTQVINEREVNFALLTKTVSRLIDPDDVPTLNKLILSGETNGRQDYWRWAGRVSLYNGMGPSECTSLVACTRQPVSHDDDPGNIGHAMACHLWVINHRRPNYLVPIGCTGELIVEGPVVGRGYVNRPKQNAAAFMIDPAWSIKTSKSSDTRHKPRRFYRSGDLARMEADGSICLIGRMDSQVKIAGQRVELGEIEDNLRRVSPIFKNSAVEAVSISHRGGAQALAVICAHDSCGKSQDQDPPNLEEKPILPLDATIEKEYRNAQAELLRYLPKYMVPAIFVPVSQLPFNASGKLERKVLRAWIEGFDASELSRYYLTSDTTVRAPTTDREKQLQALWAKVLKVPVHTIGAEDNFFRSGGDSVLCMRLIAEARSEGIAMTFANVFRTPILKDMALTMVDDENAQKRQVSAKVEPFSLYKGNVPLDRCIQEAAQDCDVQVDMIEDIYPCTSIQEALMAASSRRPESYTYEIILKLPQTMSISQTKSAFEKLVSEQAIYRTRIVFSRGVGSLQVVLKAGITWNLSKGLSVEQYLAENGPLLVEYGSQLSQFSVVQHDGDTFFVIRLHHALYDGWSMMRTWQQFKRIFCCEERQQEPVQYNKFIEHLTMIDEEEADNFWKSQL